VGGREAFLVRLEKHRKANERSTRLLESVQNDKIVVESTTRTYYSNASCAFNL